MRITHSERASVILSYLYGMQIASFLRRTILSSVACLAIPYFPHYQIRGTISGKEFIIIIIIIIQLPGF
jgi:hypothetical protein